MPTFLQGCQNFSAAYVSGNVSKAFSKNVTANSLIAVAVWWFQAGGLATNPANITIGDNRNTHVKCYSETEPQPGFYARFQVSFVAAASAGATTISVSADQPGTLLWAAHEVSTDAGLAWVMNGAANGRINVGDNPLVVGAPDVEGSYNSTNGYSFLAWAISDANELGDITTGPWSNRQYVVNNTPKPTGSTFQWFGSLATWDALNQGTGGGTQIFVGPNRVQSVAVCVNFSLITPSCDAAVASPIGGTYTGPQSVTLTQDQSLTMHYTLDGSTPTTSSTTYSTAIAITNSVQLKVLVHDPSNVLADTVSNFNYSIIPAPPANSNILITWQRRTRVGGAWLDGTGTVPLSEQSELYELEIWSLDGSTLIRTVSGLTTNLYDYTSSLQFADFGEYLPYVYIKVYQISASVGRGFVAVNPTAGKIT